MRRFLYTKEMHESLKTVPEGVVVIFEGMDGTGKTTQLQLAAEVLSNNGWHVETARAHGGTPVGEALREVSLSDVPRPALTDLYISMAMHAALAERTTSWRQQGAIILIDRGPFSMAAYQLYGDGLDPDIVWPAVEKELDLFKPELTLLYTAPVEVAIDRARRKQGSTADYFENKDNQFFDRVSSGYHSAAARYGAIAIESGDNLIPAVARHTLAAIHTAIERKSAKA